MKCEKGFTLVEVIASFVILTLVLLAFAPMVINAKKTSSTNLDNLVAIHLAEATLKRMKISYGDFLQNPNDNPPFLYQNEGEYTYDVTNCKPINCQKHYSTDLNAQTYITQVTVSQDAALARDGLIHVLVSVQNAKRKIVYKVEGYIDYETPN